jgi:hypothetical protein
MARFRSAGYDFCGEGWNVFRTGGGMTDRHVAPEGPDTLRSRLLDAIPMLENYRVHDLNDPAFLFDIEGLLRDTASALASPLNKIAADPQLRVEGWDSYDSEPLQDGPIEAARLFLSRLNVVPTVHGGVQLEWHTDGATLEVEFPPHGPTEFFLSDGRDHYFALPVSALASPPEHDANG